MKENSEWEQCSGSMNGNTLRIRVSEELPPVRGFNKRENDKLRLMIKIIARKYNLPTPSDNIYCDS